MHQNKTWVSDCDQMHIAVSQVNKFGINTKKILLFEKKWSYLEK